jgi:hypothetical protein
MGFNNPQQLKGMLGMGTYTHRYFSAGKNQWRTCPAAAIEILLLEEEEQKPPASVFDQSFIEKSTTATSNLSSI